MVAAGFVVVRSASRRPAAILVSQSAELSGSLGGLEAIFEEPAPMRDLIRSNDPVLLGFVEVLLREAGIASVELDRSMSVLEGSIGVLPRRLSVAEGDWDRARDVLVEAGLAEWLSGDDGA
jgi:hypothetical protein